MSVKEKFCKKGCIVFIGPEGNRVPGVAVFTDNIDEIDQADKKSIFISYNKESVNIRLSGYNYYVGINSAERYLQLSAESSDVLKERGEIDIPIEEYNPVRRNR